MNIVAYKRYQDSLPPYVHQEYPKWVTQKDGSQIVVQNRQEELTAIATDQTQSKAVEDPRDRQLAVLMEHLKKMESEMALLRAAQTNVDVASLLSSVKEKQDALVEADKKVAELTASVTTESLVAKPSVDDLISGKIPAKAGK